MSFSLIRRPAVTINHSNHAGLNSSDAVEPPQAEQRPFHREREVGKEAPFFTDPGSRFDAAARVLRIGLVHDAAKREVQTFAFEPVRAGDQPVGMAVALALHEIDGHEQVEFG